MTVRTSTRIPPFEEGVIRGIANLLGDTNTGMTGGEITHALANTHIPDTDASLSKSKRLYNAFVNFQNLHQVGNHIIKFITFAMSPALHTRARDRFDLWQIELNKVLCLAGFKVNNEGKVCTTHIAQTIDDAISRANRLRSILDLRKAHAKVVEYCHAEILADNYFHAVFEAVKSLSARIRELSGLEGDGSALYQNALGGDDPKLKINNFDSDSLRMEQRGFLTLLTGIYGMFRNPLGHEAKIEWSMCEQDAVDMLTTISFAHRKLDGIIQP